jgi:hypothetical protein
MPEDPPRRPRGWLVAATGFAAIAVYLAVTHVVLAEPRADMRETLGWMAGELAVLLLLWSFPASWSLGERTAVTVFVGVPLVFGVAFFGTFGDIPHEYRWEQEPARLHALWVFDAVAWSLVAGVVVPALRRLWSGLRRRRA